MTELKDVERELRRFRLRLLAAAAFVLLCFGLLAARLHHLQVVRHDDLSTQAENNRIAVVPVVPDRGLVVDRNGVVLARNYSAYTLELTPSKVDDLAATIDGLAALVEVTPRDRRRFRRLLEESRSFDTLPLRNRLTDEEVARFTAQRFRFPGVEVKARLFRSYPLGEVGSHLIGYIGRVNRAEKDAIDESEDAANYRGTEYIGKLGVEQSYEADLHGTAGFEEMETSASGRAVRRLRSHPAGPGSTVTLAVDIGLQALVEELFGERRGALVAIDPRNGEVLAFVSKPNFDPNLFVDGIDHENWKALNESPDKPLLNRALRGTYPPGSTYKPFMALAALGSGRRTPGQAISDPGYFWFGNHKFRDDKEGGHGTVDMYKSIVQSCDTYYYMLAADLGVDLIHDFMKPLGLGQLTGIDLGGELRGTLPSTAWKRAAYRRPEQKKWYAGETISLGIGQGYNAFTMLQLAQATATVAAGGARHRPHVVREVASVEPRKVRSVGAEALEALPWKREHMAFIHRAMYGVTQEGTSARSFVGAPYRSGGKTGTAQVIAIGKNEKYRAADIDERHRDHALYVAFAPLEAPRIALALVVENAGFGAQSAAPIARRVFDYVLLGKYPSEADLAATRRGESTAPIGVPRDAADIVLPGQSLAAPAWAGADGPDGAASAAPAAATAGTAGATPVAGSAPAGAPAGSAPAGAALAGAAPAGGAALRAVAAAAQRTGAAAPPPATPATRTAATATRRPAVAAATSPSPVAAAAAGAGRPVPAPRARTDSAPRGAVAQPPAAAARAAPAAPAVSATRPAVPPRSAPPSTAPPASPSATAPAPRAVPAARPSSPARAASADRSPAAERPAASARTAPAGRPAAAERPSTPARGAASAVRADAPARPTTPAPRRGAAP